MNALQTQAMQLLSDCEKKGIKQTPEWCLAYVKSHCFKLLLSKPSHQIYKHVPF